MSIGKAEKKITVLDTRQSLEDQESMAHLGNKAGGQYIGTVLREVSRGQVIKALASHARECKL